MLFAFASILVHFLSRLDNVADRVSGRAGKERISSPYFRLITALEMVWAESSMVKVFGSELNIRVNNTLLEIMGLYGQLQTGDKRAPADGLVEDHFRDDLLFVFGGGANEIQRDIIAMVGLGMPKSR